MTDAPTYTEIEPNTWRREDDGHLFVCREGQSLANLLAEIDAAASLPPDPPPVVVSKDAIWRRATDEEAGQMEAALQSQPVRVRRIYEGATLISTGDELYGVLETALVQLFGTERTAELLEPSPGL